MLRFEEIVFGPIRSRRLGSSLGINLLPEDGKFCNFDCIYCECGWNKDGRTHKRLPSAEQVQKALIAKLEDCASRSIPIDSITFSGNGEPTMHPDFAEIVDMTLELRDRLFPAAVVSVLSNATMLGRKEVMSALKKIDNPILKLDSPDLDGARLINKPVAADYDPAAVVENMKSFNGDFVLQTMFLRSPEFDIKENGRLEKWISIVRDLKPREVMVYTIDRETPDSRLGKYKEEEMRAFVQPLIDDGFKVQIRG